MKEKRSPEDGKHKQLERKRNMFQPTGMKEKFRGKGGGQNDESGDET